MKKYKLFYWSDPNMGWGVGPAVAYCTAKNKEEAREIFRKNCEGYDAISCDVAEVKQFIQPKQIPVFYSKRK